MIIVPTEKQFDWRHTPVVLCALVLLNLLVFFFYQIDDNKKMIGAMQTYHEYGYFEHEWPLFEQYLISQKETDLVETYRKQHQDEYYLEIIGDLLMREGFYHYLQEQDADSDKAALYEDWSLEREELHQTVQSVSFIAHGLRASELKVSSFLTHQFLHGGIMHLLGNMFFLVICGFAVEAAIGHWRFLAFYLLSGFAAGLAQAASDWSSTVPLVGASGAISGVMAMYLAVFRFKKIEFFYWFFFIVGYFRVPALFILPVYIGKELYSFYSATESNIGFMAHAGGFVSGAILIGGALLLNRSMLNRDYIDTDQSINPYQEKLASIYLAIERHHFDRALSTTELLIKESGLCFELANIRYNLLKISRDEALTSAIINLLSLPFLTPIEIEKLEKIWNEHPEVHSKLSEQAAIKLGVQFSMLNNPQTAEQVFQGLLHHVSEKALLVKFANNLSTAFLQDPKKTSYYSQLAIELAQGE